MSLDPKSLRLFIRAIEMGTISAAAAREHIAAAALSKRISQLEDFLGTKLVARSNKGLEPTAAGWALSKLSQQVLDDLDNIRVQMRDYARGIKGRVRVFANISAITQFLPADLSSFLATNPLVEVEIQERVSSAILAGVEENAADIGILVMGGSRRGLEMHAYREDDLAVIVPRRHPLSRRSSVSFAETLTYDYVGLHSGSQLNTQLERAASELGRSWRCRVQLTSYDALCHMVEAGLGIGALPQRLGLLYSRGLQICVLKLEERWAHRTLGICFRSYKALSPAARLLVDHLQFHKSSGSKAR